jgi:hypothetical protein
MKKRFAIVNSVLMMAVLFAMLLQSMHSFEHIGQLFSKKECHHKYTGQTEISHQHHPFDHCFVCEFTFSAFLSPQAFSYSLRIPQSAIPFQNSTFEAISSFSGSSYSLRGPPSAIV